MAKNTLKQYNYDVNARWVCLQILYIVYRMSQAYTVSSQKKKANIVKHWRKRKRNVETDPKSRKRDYLI